jgi:integrase
MFDVYMSGTTSSSERSFTEAVIGAFKQYNPDVAEHTTIYDVKESLSPEQVRELKSSTMERNFHFKMFKVLLETGVTVDELVNLRFGNVDVTRNLLTVAAQGTWEPRSRYAVRQLPIDSTLTDLLLTTPGTKDEYLFSVRDGKPYRKESVIYSLHLYASHCQSITKTIGTREIRRTYAYNEIIKGTPLKTIVYRLGHKDAIVTLRFLFDLKFESIAKIVNATTA